MKRTFQSIRVPALIFLLSQALIWAWIYIIGQFFPMNPEAGITTPDSIPSFLQVCYRWDATFYYDIAHTGYYSEPTALHSVAFFPLYPALIALGAKAGIEIATWGVVLNSFTTLLAYIFLYKLALLEFKDSNIARLSVLFLAFFPTSYYLCLLYTESLFLLLSISAFYFARTQKWAWVSALGVLATATRPTGIFLWGALVLEWMNQQGWSLDKVHTREAWENLCRGVKKSPVDVFCLALIPMGLVSYMVYLHHSFGHADAFLKAQSHWNRTPKNPIVEILRSVLKSFTMLARDSRYRFDVPTNAVATIAWIVAIPYTWKRLGQSYGAYCFVSLMVPLSTGMTSLSRFLLLAFPLHLILAEAVKNERLRVFLLAIFALLLLGLCSETLRWYPIA